MARKTGKAARRQTRQKRAQRAGQRASQPRPSQASAAPSAATPETPPHSESVLPPPSTTTGVTPEAAQQAPGRRSRSGSRVATSGSPNLRQIREDYAYVGRELRNIAVLVALMALVLAAATVAFNVFDLGPT